MKSHQNRVYQCLTAVTLLIVACIAVGCVPQASSLEVEEGARHPSTSYNDGKGLRWKVGDFLEVKVQKSVYPPILMRNELKDQAESKTYEDRPELLLQSLGSFSDIKLSPNEKFLVSKSAGNSLIIFDLEKRRIGRTLKGHTAWVRDFAISPDSKYIATCNGDDDSTLKIWDVKTGRILHDIQLEPYASTEGLALYRLEMDSLDFSPDGKHLAVSNGDDIYIFDVMTGKEVKTIKGIDDAGLHDITYSPNGSQMMTFGEKICLWDIDSNSIIRTFFKDQLEMSHAQGRFSPDGKFFTKAIEMRNDDAVKSRKWVKARIWNVATGKRHLDIAIPSTEEYRYPFSTNFSPDGRRAIVTTLHKIMIFDTSDGRLISTIKGGYHAYVEAAISKNGRNLYISDGGSLVIWDLDKEEMIWKQKQYAVGERSTIDPQQKYLYSYNYKDGDFWDLNLGGVRKVGKLEVDGVLKSVSPDIGMMAITDPFAIEADYKTPFGSIQIWDTITGERLHLLPGYPDQIPGKLVFSPDGGKLIANASNTKTFRLWDLKNGKLIHTFSGFSPVGTDELKFSQDGSRIISTNGYDKEIRVWSTNTKKLLRTFRVNQFVYEVAISPDNKLLATEQRFLATEGRQIKLWDIKTGRLMHILLESSSNSFGTMTFTPDNKHLVFVNKDHSIVFWKIGTNDFQFFKGHQTFVTSISFSENGLHMFSTAKDGVTAIFELSTGKLLAQMINLLDTSDWLVVTPDGLFDGTPNAWKQLAWRFNNDTFDSAPGEVFFNDFYHPGLLNDILNGKSPKAPLNIANKDRRQPGVSLTVSNTLKAKSTTERMVTVQIRVTEALVGESHTSGSGARDVRLFRNGLLVKAWKGDVLNGQANRVLEATLPIVAGQNVLQAYAFSNANIKSEDATITITGAENLKRPSRLFLFAIGVDQYDNKNFNLKYAVADADAIINEVKKQQKKIGQFETIEVIKLLNNKATKKNILSVLNQMAGKESKGNIPKVGPEDVVLIYFAGHGTTKEQRFYMLPHNLNYKGTFDALDEAGLAKITQNSISDRELELALESVDAGEMLLFIDACNSGQALEAEEKRRGPMNAKGLAQLAYEKGMNIITAAQGFQLANENTELGHGFLTYALVEEGLKTKGADSSPKDGNVTVREWIDYAAARVPEIHEGFVKNATRGLQLTIKKANVEKKIDWVLQRPRVFYRREVEAEGFVVAKPGK